MLRLTYDGSFEGYLSAIFVLFNDYGYDKQPLEAVISTNSSQHELFTDNISISTQHEHAARVLQRLERSLEKSGIQQLLMVYLSECADWEACLLAVLRYALQHPRQNILTNYANPHVMRLSGIVKSVSRERHRMLAFVRFELMQNGIYFARIEPDFNVLPLIGKHFQQRYQDQHWAIYDLQRAYGIYFDGQALQIITDADCSAPAYAETEAHYQALWQSYFQHVNIPERRNQKLHLQYLPRRYWKYLTEKTIGH